MRELLQTRRLFVVVLALGLFILAARNVTDPDVWWHLRTGQLMLQNHAVFHSDPYSFTKAGQPWVDHEWLSQILIFGLYRVGGWGGLIAGFAAVTAAAFLIVFLRCPGRPYVAGAITTWGALASVPCWGVRPQMLTLLLASVFLLILERSAKRPVLLWWAPLLMLLWVNLHAGCAVGIAFLLVFLAGEALDAAVGYRETPNLTGRPRNLCLALIACLAVVPLNPYGTKLYRYPLETIHSRAMLAYIGEWLSPNFHSSMYAATLLMMLAVLVAPALSPRRLHARELLLLAMTMYAALRSVRHIPIFVLVAVPLLSAMIQARLEESGKAGIFGFSLRPLTQTKMAVNALLLAGFVIFSAIRFRYVMGRQAESEVHEFPAAAAAVLAKTPAPGPLLNHYNWGGYFIWKLYPEDKVFIDGRADLYGDRFMDDFASTYHLTGPSWRASLDSWSIRTVVLPPDAPLVTALQSMPEWKTTFADRQAVILTMTR